MVLNKSAVKEIFWPTLNDRASTKRAMMGGVVAAAFVSVVTLLLSAYRYFGPYSMLASRGSAVIPGIIDGVIFALIGFGIFERSRVAAVLGLLCFVVDKGYQFYANPKQIITGYVTAAFLIFVFIGAVRGAFQYHVFQKQLRQNALNKEKRAV